MKKIRKKVWPKWFDDVASGKKKYELRLNDFDVEAGDILVLEEWDPETKEYTGRSVEREVTYAADFKFDDLWWPKEEIEEKGLLVMSLKEL